MKSVRPTLAVLLPSLCLLFPTGCEQKPAATAESQTVPPVPVRVAEVALSNHAPPIRAAAELAHVTEAELAFAGSGVVEAVLVRPGDRVQRGQTLARLRPDTVEAQTAQAGAAFEQARRALTRVERLHAERVATLEMLQDARTAVETAEAAVRITEFNRTFAVIKAPGDGVILRRHVEPDELAAAGRPVLAFAAEAGGWIARAHLSARDVARLSAGAAAVLADGLGGTVTGRVTRIAAAADPATRTVPVEITLDAPPPAAHSGRIISALIDAAPVPPRPAVPLTAIREGAGDRAFVFVLRPGADAVSRVQVDIELIDDGRVFLRSPLEAGLRVVTAGGQFLRDGARVSITN